MWWWHDLKVVSFIVPKLQKKIGYESVQWKKSTKSTNFLIWYCNTCHMVAKRYNPLIYDTSVIVQQTQDVEPMLFECWASGVDAGPILKQHCCNVWCLLGGIYVHVCMYTFFIQISTWKNYHTIIFPRQHVSSNNNPLLQWWLCVH